MIPIPGFGPWTEQAACKGLPTSWWFADTDTPAYRRAMVKCWSCPVRVECMTHAMDYAEEFGIWGGTNEYHRRTVRSAIRNRDIDYDQAAEVLSDIARAHAASRRIHIREEKTA